MIRNRVSAAAIAAVVLTGSAWAQTSLTVCHAGSLSAAFADVAAAFKAQHPGVTIVDVAGGSVSLARRLATGAQACDVYASADYVDIDRMLKPAGIAPYTIVFARGRMVLAYLSIDPKAQGVTAENWYQALVAPGVHVGGAHPFLDPGGYRAHMIFELAQQHYRMPSLYNALLEHYVVMPAGAALGRDFNFQIIYEHSAAAAARGNPAYRYVRLPEQIDLSNPAQGALYSHAGVTIPGLGTPKAASSVLIPATGVAWGVTIPASAANQDLATAFLRLLLGEEGTHALKEHGPQPMAPAAVSAADYRRLPPSLRPLARPN